MLKMAQDLFYTQLNSIDNLAIMDKRPDLSSVSSKLPDISSTPRSKIVFYAEIKEERTGEQDVKWNCSFNAKRLQDGKVYSTVKIYDSYYKMLTGARDSIDELLQPLKQNTESTSLKNSENFSDSEAVSKINIENLSGNWTGEPYADKIVILRGGRGFIIFKNGATMNIQVSISDSNIKIKQVGKSNASFFPEFSRETALKAAVSAPPAEWIFKMDGESTLRGTKNTLIMPDSSSSPVQGKIKSVWTKN